MKEAESAINDEKRSDSLSYRVAMRRKRWYTLFHGPKSGGKSRHGLPVRAIHSTASTNNRLSAAVRPGSVDLPGSKGPIRSYWSSLSISLGILFFRKRQDVNRFPHRLTAPSSMIVNRP